MNDLEFESINAVLAQVEAENADLRTALADARETLEWIRDCPNKGCVDCVLFADECLKRISGKGGER